MMMENLPFLVANLIRKGNKTNPSQSFEEVYKSLMLGPLDYYPNLILNNKEIKHFMALVALENGGGDYKEKFDDSFPARVIFTLRGKQFFF